VPTIAMIVTIKLRNVADADRYEANLLASRDRFLRDESGTLQFDILRPEGTENTLMIYEVYADEAAFKAHHEGDIKKQGITEIEDIQREAVWTKCIRLD
jgi:quinol monooxygenase YgiN